ncbi:3'-5' exonuclease [Halosimplex halobium]|uniref:3'-5' exonuclease n=1 Tax=Halosimplex halobium TaxID=3396618 RepID=UPI003F56B3EF
MSEIDLEDVEIKGPPVTESCKLEGVPGGGKTTSGAARVGKLVKEHEYGVDDVCWVTYRKSLAQDILDRLYDWGILEDWDMEQTWTGRTKYIGTVHAIANRLIDTRNMDVAGYSDYRDFCKSQYGVQYSGDPTNSQSHGKGQLLIDILKWLRNNRISAHRAKECPKYSDLVSVWPSHPRISEVDDAWEEYKEEQKLYDFHEMLEIVVKEKRTPDCDIVVIDEYHDAFPLLDEVAQLWIDNAEIAIVLGDSLQVVNKHEGATPEFFERVDLQHVPLNTTYRVPQTHWNLATSVLSKQHVPPSDVTIESESDGYVFEVCSPTYSKDSFSGDWDAPVEKKASVDTLINQFDEGTNLILTRTRDQATALGRSLQKAGIFFKSQQGAGGWNQSDKRVDLYNSICKINGVKIEERGWNENVLSWNSWADRDESPDNVTLSPGEARRLLEATKIEYTQFDSREDKEDIQSWIRTEEQNIDLEHFAGFVTDEWFKIFPNAGRAVDSLTGIQSQYKDVIRAALRKNNCETIDIDEIKTQLLTIHGSKGYEADNVILYDGITSRIQESISRDYEMRQNEARTWYVALTRASENLVIVRDAFDFLDSYLPAHLASEHRKPLLAGDGQ